METSFDWCYISSSIFRIGPLVISWCMRMEAKNSYFKKVARISNYKNVPYSVAKRHQRLLCAYLQGQFFSYDELQCGPCMLKPHTRTFIITQLHELNMYVHAGYTYVYYILQVRQPPVIVWQRIIYPFLAIWY